MITPAIGRMDDRMDAIFLAMEDSQDLSGYVLQRSRMQHHSQHETADLKKGVLMLVSNGEGQYSKNPGMIAKNGLHEFILIGHLKVDDQAKPAEVEAAELDMAENVKSFIRSGVKGMELYLDDIQNSWQQEFPYGWIIVRLTAGSPGQTIN